MKHIKCGCISVAMGSYDNQVVVQPPSWFTQGKLGLDRCIALEIIELWAKGVQTTGHCCGHNCEKLYENGGSFIGVITEHIPKMKELGYKVARNSLYPKREDSFTPKNFMIPKELPND